MILTNGALVLPDGVHRGLAVSIEGGKISEIAATDSSPRAGAIDLDGNFIAPGFVDLHVHGAIGRDTMEGSREAFRAICNYHAGGGTTSLLLTTATAPLAEIGKVLQAVREAREMMPQIVGAHVEGPFISRERPGAQWAEFIRHADESATAELLEFADVIKRVTLAPELPGALELIRHLSSRGIAVSGGHSDAWDEDARAGFDAGMRHVTHTFNCMSSARRRGAERVAGLLEFALSEPQILCELIADGHHVSPTLMKMLYRAKGPRGICLVTDATAGAGLPEGTNFQLAGIECVVDRGVCLLADRTALAGSASRMIDLVRTVVTKLGIPLHEAILMASGNPARALGLPHKGKIEVGADADLVSFSKELEVTRTFLAGIPIYPR